MTTVALARSLLFVPGSRPDRFAKASNSGADAVVLDLEDAVGADEKSAARGHVASWLLENAAVVRINAAGTSDHEADLDVVAGLPGLLGVMLPKAEDAHQVESVAARSGAPVLPLVETAQGIRSVDRVAAASGSARLVIGTLDLAADLGAEDTWDSMLLARSELVLASRVAGLPAPVDGVHVALADVDGLTASTARARSLGFGARLCIHPEQVRVVHAAFAPSDAEIERARAVLDMADAVGTVDGVFVDEPVRKWARAVLERAG